MSSGVRNSGENAGAGSIGAMKGGSGRYLPGYLAVMLGVLSALSWGGPAVAEETDAWVIGDVGHTATLLEDGSILIAGGEDFSGEPVAAVQEFDPETETYIRVGDMSTPRSNQTATLLPDGRVLIAGGQDGQYTLASLEVFDPETGQFTSLSATLLTPRQGHMATSLDDGRVLFEGGNNEDGSLETAEFFDPDAGTVTVAEHPEDIPFPTVSTDKIDYIPGEAVIVTGIGWDEGEIVALLFDETPLEHAPTVVDVVADGQGNIRTDEFIVEDHDVGTTFTLNATGLSSGWSAQTWFSDGSALELSNAKLMNMAGTQVSAVNIGQLFILQAVVTNKSSGTIASQTAFNSIDVTLNTPAGWTMSPSDIPLFSLTPGASKTVQWTLTASSSGLVGLHVTGVPSRLSCTTVGIDCTDDAPLYITAEYAAHLTVTDIQASSSHVQGGQAVTVGMTVANDAPSAGAVARDVTATLSAIGSASATCSGSLPVSANINADDSVNFLFRCVLSGDGTLSLVGSASGTDENSGATVTASGTSSPIIVDSTAPVLSLPAGVKAEATGPSGAAVSYSATATDNIDGVVPAACAPASGSVFPLGITTVTCSATDAVGNSATGSFQVTVQDTTAPVLAGCPTDVTLEATGPGGASFTWAAPTASDLVDGSRPVTCTPASGSIFPLGTTPVTCSVSDSRGNQTATTFVVTVVDTTPPTLNPPADQVLEATGPSGTAATFSASATDLVDGSLPVTCSPTSGSIFAIGTTVVQCTATDAHGNSSQATFTITVQDTTAPSLTLPADIVAEATGPGGATVVYATNAVDLVDGTIAPECSPVSGSAFAIGTTAVLCTAADAHGNSSSGGFTITVRDTTPPALTLPADIVTEATGPDGATVVFVATAEDIVDGEVAPVCAPVSGSTFGLGVTSVICTATDAHGNSSQGSFSVTVQDTTPPMLSLPDDIVAEATDGYGAAVSFTAEAVDVVDGAVIPECSPASGEVYPLDEVTVVTCVATDAHGNASTGAFTITVEDTTPPIIAGVPADMTLEATGPEGAEASWLELEAFDLVDGDLPVECFPESGSVFPIDVETVVECLAIDAHDNLATETFTVTVVDTTAPELTIPDDVSATATSAEGAVVHFTATATDLVDGALDPVCVPASGTLFPLGTTTVDCTVADAHGNSSQASFEVTVTYAWSGYLQPIDVNGSSVSKLGSSVPVKFQLTGDSAKIADATARLYLAPVANGVVGAELEATSNSASTTGNLFRYDSQAMQYIFNLYTKKLTAGTWQLRIDLGDGVLRVVNITFKK